jgi:hypothetical protein
MDQAQIDAISVEEWLYGNWEVTFCLDILPGTRSLFPINIDWMTAQRIGVLYKGINV